MEKHRDASWQAQVIDRKVENSGHVRQILYPLKDHPGNTFRHAFFWGLLYIYILYIIYIYYILYIYIYIILYILYIIYIYIIYVYYII